jgi:hypothetical protein
MQVVKHDEHRRAAGDVLEKAGDAIEEPEARLWRFG